MSSTLQDHVLFVYQNTNIVRLVLCVAMGMVLVTGVQILRKVHRINTLIEIVPCHQIS